MINKVKLLKNIGKFYDYASKGTGLDWHKNTFLFAPNAYGKSTLVNVLRSLRDSDPKIIRSRKTVNSPTSPEAVIIIDGVNYVFDGTKWDRHWPALQIFDAPFIHANIFAHEIEHEHRKNIHRIIIGAQGVKLAQELSTLKSREKDQRKQLDNLVTQFRSAGFQHALDTFLSIHAQEESAVVERIKKLEQDIKSKESEAQLRTLSGPQTLVFPAFDLTALKSIATRKVAAIHEDAEKRVLAHINKNIMDKNDAKAFIRQGLDYVQADCPFCGQNLNNASDLIAAYRQYFDDSFRQYQQNLAQESERLVKWNLDNELTKLVSIHNANTAAMKQWEPFVGVLTLPDVSAIVEGCRVRLGELKAKSQGEFDKKLKDPNVDVDLSFLEGLSAELISLNATVDAYNATVAAFTAKTKDFIDNLPKSDADSLRSSLAKEREIEKRFKPEWKKWASDYEATKNRVDNLLTQKNAKQSELEDYTKAIFRTHQKRINELLLTLGADFAITDLAGKTDERANETYSDFAFLILEKKVPLTTRQDDVPCFKNTLSEGDKSTLAFAFFIAAMERLADLDKQIMILDDPLSSLDENRREATARVLLSLSPKLNQICVFTHKRDFLWMLTDKMPDNRVHQIRSDKKNGSWIEVFDVEHDRKGDYERMVEDMERYLVEDFGPTPDIMQGNIRKIFEVVLKTKYYRTLVADIRAKKGFAKLLETLFNAGLLDNALKSRLFDLCSVTNGPHHGEIVDAPDKKLSRDELIPLIREALTLLTKV